MDILAYSNIFLWIATAGLLVAVFALSRQIGILYERVAPMGALMMAAGPQLGDKAPQIDVPTIDGRSFALVKASDRNTLLFFLSPDCPICKKLIPIIKSLARSESKFFDVIFASDGEAMFHQKFRERVAIQEYTYLLSQDLGMAFRVSKLPYAVLIDAQGIVRGKGLVNSREQLESLLTAMELNVASAQEYISRRAIGARE
jgi:methylamine dehydrogenase accessory protein MauD